MRNPHLMSVCVRLGFVYQIINLRARYTWQLGIRQKIGMMINKMKWTRGGSVKTGTSSCLDQQGP